MPGSADAQRFIVEHIGADWHQLAWLGLTAALVWLAWRWYGQRPPGWRGRLLRGLRCTSVILLISLAAAPAWLRIERDIQPGHLAVAIDRSASMARTDLADGAARITAANDLQTRLAAVLDPQRMTASHWTVGERLAPVAEPPAWQAADATGASSNLGPQLLALADQARPDLLVLVSDGRRTRGADLSDIGQALAGRGLRINALITGGTTVDPELRLVDIVGPRDIPRDERQPYTIRWRHRALPSDASVTISILDGHGQVLDEHTLTPEAEDELISQERSSTLIIHLLEAGTHDLLVRVRQGELVDEEPLRVRVHDRRLRVLLLAQRPRWDVRYLRAALGRDRTVDVHSYLHPGSWVRWGDESYGPSATLRLDSTSVSDYDAIIIGDLPPIALAPAVQTAIADGVRRHGLGLLWLPGERGHLASFTDGPLAALIPAPLPAPHLVTESYRAGRGFHVRRSTFAEESGLLAPPGDSWLDLPPLAGRAPIEQIQPGSQVLLEDDQARPLIISRDYGAGRVILIGIDDTWRWRQGVGDSHLHRLHSQLLRWASSGRLFSEQPWRISANPFQLHPGAQMRLSVAPAGAIDPSLSVPDAVTVRLDGPDNQQILARLPRQADGNIYSLDRSAPGIGTWQLSVTDGLDPTTVQDLRIQITQPDEERLDPRSDRAALLALCQATGGQVYDDPAALIAALPDTSSSTEHRHRSRLWDRPWMLIAVIMTLCLEWACRRWWRLP